MVIKWWYLKSIIVYTFLLESIGHCVFVKIFFLEKKVKFADVGIFVYAKSTEPFLNSFQEKCNILHHQSQQFTIPFKINHPVNKTRMYWRNFLLPTDRTQQNIFVKIHIEVFSPYLHASFVTFSVKIGPLFEVQWAFE